jgi:hypothetical protein
MVCKSFRMMSLEMAFILKRYAQRQTHYPIMPKYKIWFAKVLEFCHQKWDNWD